MIIKLRESVRLRYWIQPMDVEKKGAGFQHGFLTHPSGETTTKDGYNAYIDFLV